MWGLRLNKTTGREPFYEVGAKIVTTGRTMKIMSDSHSKSFIAP